MQQSPGAGMAHSGRVVCRGMQTVDEAFATIPWNGESCRRPEGGQSLAPRSERCHKIAGSKNTPAPVERFALFHFAVRSREDFAIKSARGSATGGRGKKWDFFASINRCARACMELLVRTRMHGAHAWSSRCVRARMELSCTSRVAVPLACCSLR
jgi:hypothetical protein